MTGFRVKHGMTKEVYKWVFTYGFLNILCVMGNEVNVGYDRNHKSA